MKCSLDKITVCLLLVYLFALYWIICFNGIFHNLFMIAMLSMMVFSWLQRQNWKIKLTKKEKYCLFIFLTYILLNVVRSRVTYRALVNAFFIVCTLFCLFYLSDLYRKSPEKLYFLRTTKWLIFLNLYFWVNAIIILLQSKIPGLLGAKTFDDFTGLFGSGSTHNITVYCIMLTCLNMQKLIERNRNFIGIVYLISIIIMMFILVSVNDNTAFIVLFPAGIMLYILGKNRINFRTVLKVGIFLMIGIIFIFIIASHNSFLSEFINTRFRFKAEAYLHFNNNGMTSSGFGDERIRAFEFAIKYGKGLFCGEGFNVDFGDISTLENYTLYARKMRVYVGMSDLSGITYCCGIWFYLFICICIAYMVNKTLFDNRKGNIFVILGVIIIFTIYTTFTKSLTMIIVFFLLITSLESGWRGKGNYVFNSKNDFSVTYIQS